MEEEPVAEEEEGQLHHQAPVDVEEGPRRQLDVRTDNFLDEQLHLNGRHH